jgi:undecaprenyl-diphosphatase
LSVPSRGRRAAPERVKAEIAPLAALLGGAALALGFGLLAEAVMTGTTTGLDRDVLLALRMNADPADPIGPPWLEEAARDLTALGSNAVLGIVVLASVVYLVFVGKSKVALLLVASLVGGIVLVSALKIGFARPRPDIVPPLARVFTASFPSSHAALSAAVYLTLGALLARIVEPRQIKLFFVGLAVCLTLIVGLSRVYLGLHYPTDVIAGWCVGAAWAMICWSVALYLQRRGGIEPPGADPRAEV